MARFSGADYGRHSKSLLLGPESAACRAGCTWRPLCTQQHTTHARTSCLVISSEHQLQGVCSRQDQARRWICGEPHRAKIGRHDQAQSRTGSPGQNMPFLVNMTSHNAFEHDINARRTQVPVGHMQGPGWNYRTRTAISRDRCSHIAKAQVQMTPDLFFGVDMIPCVTP